MRSYLWDEENQLVGAAQAALGTFTFTWNADRQRVRRADSLSDLQLTYDLNNLQSTRDVLGELADRFTWQPRLFGNLLSRHSNPRDYQFDALGSTRQLTDADQTVTDRIDYNAWGQPVETPSGLLLLMSGGAGCPGGGGFASFGGQSGGWHECDLDIILPTPYDTDTGEWVDGPVFPPDLPPHDDWMGNPYPCPSSRVLADIIAQRDANVIQALQAGGPPGILLQPNGNVGQQGAPGIRWTPVLINLGKGFVVGFVIVLILTPVVKLAFLVGTTVGVVVLVGLTVYGIYSLTHGALEVWYGEELDWRFRKTGIKIPPQERANLGAYLTGLVAGAGLSARWARKGKEFRISRKPGRVERIAPWGNVTEKPHPQGRWFHYHRRVPDPTRPGEGKPGQGIGRHRPFETRPTDTCFRERF